MDGQKVQRIKSHEKVPKSGNLVNFLPYKMKKELTPEVNSIVQQMLNKLKATPFDGRTKATLQMLEDASLMDGHRAEIESYFKRHYYWNQ